MKQNINQILHSLIAEIGKRPCWDINPSDQVSAKKFKFLFEDLQHFSTYSDSLNTTSTWHLNFLLTQYIHQSDKTFYSSRQTRNSNTYDLTKQLEQLFQFVTNSKLIG
jgi:hypothetical protein